MTTSTPLWAITIHSITSQQGEALSEFFEFEAVSSSWNENKTNPELWDFHAHVDELPNPEDLNTRLSMLLEDRALDNLSIQEIPNQDWLAATYRSFPPLEIANFYIYGSHIDHPEPGDRIPLLVNAATAFGSGEHETTEGCLKAIHQLAQDRQFHHPLDMGCGSGILAMAMATTFKCAVLAADNDPEAVKMTAENARLNDLEHKIIPLLSEGFDDSSLSDKGPYDLITANILAGPLCSMALSLSDHLEEGGVVILSGLLTTQKDMVETSYRMANCNLVDCITIGDWSTLIMRKALDE